MACHRLIALWLEGTCSFGSTGSRPRSRPQKTRPWWTPSSTKPTLCAHGALTSTPMMELSPGECGEYVALSKYFPVADQLFPRNKNPTLEMLLLEPLDPLPLSLEVTSTADTRWLYSLEAIKSNLGRQPQKWPSPEASLPVTALDKLVGGGPNHIRHRLFSEPAERLGQWMTI